jgi:phosphohistidine phosphatase
MALYLAQHGKSLPKEKDPNKGLSEDGTREVERIALAARNYGVTPAAIMHSGKRRAQQTAAIFAGALDPPKGLEAVNGLAPLDDVTALSVKSQENIMLVGHLPFMEKLTTYLTTGAAERPAVLKFQNGGIVCLDQDPDNHSWFIKWTLMPHIG